MSARTNSSERVRELYDWLTDLMAHTHGGYLHGGYWAGPDRPTTTEAAGDRLSDVVVERCALAPGQHVLDVGSGNGETAVRVALAQQVLVSGVTISEYQVEQARDLADAYELAEALDFRLADMRAMPFPDNGFDAAYAIESVCHIPEREQAFAEIGRVLRPGGRVAVTDFVLRRPITDPRTAARVAANATSFENGPILPRQEYEALVRAAGLEVVEFTDIGEQVRPSFKFAADNMRAARDVVGDRLSDEEFAEMVGNLESFGAIAEIGYTLIVARKPA